jgi:MFS family permease
MTTITRPLPTSSELERDARRASADSTNISPNEIAIGVVIGRTAEFFDFFVYGIASVLVFPALFFPDADPLTAMAYSFAVFSLAFVARPIGSVFFLAVDRRHGRGVKLTIAMFLLGGSTAGIAFLPPTVEIGWLAILLLSLFRIGQGFALGGAWDGLAALLAMNAPENRRGWYAMMPQLGAPLGFLLAAALFSYFLYVLSGSDFYEWGWRYPFFVAFAINVVALFARLRLVATNEFERAMESRDLEAQPVSEVLRHQGYNVVIGAFVPLASFALFHLVTIFALSWATLFSGRAAADFLHSQMIGGVVCAIAIAASGLLADRIGRRTLLSIGAVLIAGLSFATPYLLRNGPGTEMIFIVVGFALLGISLGQAAGAVASNFSAAYRYTGSALTSDISWLVGAGFAPLVALVLASHFGLVMVGAYLLSGAACTLVALWVNRKAKEIWSA